MKTVVITGSHLSRKDGSVGTSQNMFSLTLPYPYEIMEGEEKLARDSRTRALMFFKNFFVVNKLKEQLVKAGTIQYFDTVLTCEIAGVSDFKKSDFTDKELETFKSSMMFNKKVIKPLELTFSDVQKLRTDQIIFAFMSASIVGKEDVTSFIARNMYSMTRGTVEERRELLCDYLGLEDIEQAEIEQTIQTAGIEDFLEVSKDIKVAPAKKAKSISDGPDLSGLDG